MSRASCPNIESDQAEVSALIREIASVCAFHGAQWHTDLSIRIADGSFSLHAKPESRGTLLEIPKSLLIKVNMITWSEESSTIAADTSCLPSAQRDLANLMIEAYNRTNKLSQWKINHLGDELRSNRILTSWLRPLKPLQCQHLLPQNNLSSFLGSRCYGWQEEANHNMITPALMPLIDLVNNHHAGASFISSTQTLSLEVSQMESGNECFANYGYGRDPLDLLLHYSYFDKQNPYAHSAGLRFEVPELGRIHVQSENSTLRHKQRNKPGARWQQDMLKISPLLLDSNNPLQTKTLLNLALQSCLISRGHNASTSKRHSRIIIQAILDENLRLLSRLEETSKDLRKELHRESLSRAIDLTQKTLKTCLSTTSP